MQSNAEHITGVRGPPRRTPPEGHRIQPGAAGAAFGTWGASSRALALVQVKQVLP
jgi:hypothetical protein